MDSWYYEYANLSTTVKADMIKGNRFVRDFRYIKDIIDMKISMFDYEDLPDEDLTSEILETALMFNNKLCFYFIPGLQSWKLCKWLPDGDYNEYYKPRFVKLESIVGSVVYATRVPYKDIILVKDNTMDIIPFLVLSEYIAKIKKLEEDMEKVVTIATLPLMVVGNKKQASALKQVAKKLGSSDPFIIGDDMIGDQVKSFGINATVEPAQIYELRHKYINECRASVGIYSVDEKRERIVTQELLNLNDFSDTVYQEAVNERKRFVNQLNAKGCNVKLKEVYKQVFKESVKEAEQLAIANAGGESNIERKDGNKDA